MTPAERAALETQLGALLVGREYTRAATLALRSYGPEILTLLSSILGSRHDADDAFSLFCESLWKGLPGFEGRSSLRTWMYTVARNASHRFHEQRHADREVLVTNAEVERVAAHVRTTTRTRMKQAKTRMQRLRAQLDPEDQMLLILRVERELEWKELARVMNEDGSPDDAQLARKSARLRKRFQSIRERLREMMERDRSSTTRR